MNSPLSALKRAEAFLDGHGVASAKRTAQDLLAAALGCRPMDLFLTDGSSPLTVEEEARFERLLQRAAHHEPLAYILGCVEFYGCSLSVDPSVLIPRQESEILLDLACRRLAPTKKAAPKSAWDICCGSGCLGIGFKRAQSDFEVTLADCSAKALGNARANALQNRVNVTFLQGDLLEPFKGMRADVIFCNPPYIADHEWEGLDRSVRAFEPKKALVSGPTGLECYERLAESLPRFLKPGAKVFLEIGATQGEAVNKIFSSPFWRSKEASKDWAGKDRFFFLEAEEEFEL